MPSRYPGFNDSKVEQTVLLDETVRIPRRVAVRADQGQVLASRAKLPLQSPALHAEKPVRRSTQSQIGPGQHQSHRGGNDQEEAGKSSAEKHEARADQREDVPA